MADVSGTPAKGEAQPATPVSGVYEIRNLSTGKRYVGSAVDTAQRWREHRWGLRADRHGNRHLQASWKKHGEDVFVFAILEVCGPAYLIVREQAAIDRLKPEFNICQTAGSTLGRRHTAEARERIAAKKVGLKLPPRDRDHRAKLGAAHRGKAKAPEHMAALQAGRQGQVFSDERRERITEGLRAAYAEGRRSRARPPEYRDKIASTLRGRKATDEHRANQSAAQRGKKRGPYELDPAKADARREAGRRLAERCNKRPMPPHVAAALRAANEGRKLSDEHCRKISANSLRAWTPERKIKHAAAIRAHHQRRREAAQATQESAHESRIQRYHHHKGR
jgi:group I intron endonuclease